MEFNINRETSHSLKGYHENLFAANGSLPQDGATW